MRGDQPLRGAAFPLIDIRVPTRLKLSSLWAATMFCRLAGDDFGPCVPGALAGVGPGGMAPLGHASPVDMSVLPLAMAAAGIMVALSVLLPAVLCRWACVVLGFVYAGTVAVGMPGTGAFHQVLGAVEMCLTLSLAVMALRWPRSGLG